jgi:hypothetical protein
VHEKKYLDNKNLITAILDDKETKEFIKKISPSAEILLNLI